MILRYVKHALMFYASDFIPIVWVVHMNEGQGKVSYGLLRWPLAPLPSDSHHSVFGSRCQRIFLHFPRLGKSMLVHSFPLVSVFFFGKSTGQYGKSNCLCSPTARWEGLYIKLPESFLPLRFLLRLPAPVEESSWAHSNLSPIASSKSGQAHTHRITQTWTHARKNVRIPARKNAA